LVKSFDEACDKYIKWSGETVKALSNETQGTPEKQLEELQKIGQQAVNSSSTSLSKLLENANKLEEADIIEQSDHTVQELQSFDEQIKTTFNKRAKGLESAIYASKMGSVSKEQLDELHDTFKHFDKQNSGKLPKNEFKAACAAVGEDILDSELDNVFKKYDKDKDGFVSFEEYIEYMSSLVKEGTSFEDVVASFKELAGGNDKIITEQQIRSNIEDNEEAEYLIKNMPKTDGGFDYVAYCKKTYGK